MTDSGSSSEGRTDNGVSPIVSATAESGREPMCGLDLLLVLSHHKRALLYIAVVTLVVATLISLVLPNIYTATTTILPPAPNESSAAALVGQQLQALSGLSNADLGLRDPTDLCIAVLRSQTIQQAIVDQFGLKHVYSVRHEEDARKKLGARTAILADKEGQVSIGVSDRDPKRAAQMAAAYVDQLRRLGDNLSRSEATHRRAFFEQKLSTERGALEAAELSLKDAEEKTGFVQPDKQAQAILEAVASTRAQVEIEEVKLAAMRLYATPENPDLKRAELELASLRGNLSQLERRTDALGNGDLEIPTRRLPEVEMEYLRRARDLKYHEALFEFLTRQAEVARLDEAKTGPGVDVIDEATVPETRSGPHRTTIVLLTMAIVLLSSCVWLVALASIRSDEQAAARFARLKRSLTWNS